MSTPQDNLIRGLKAMLKWGNGPCGGGGTVDDHSNGRREAEYRMKVELRRLLKEFESAANSELADVARSAYVCDRWSGEDSPASNEDGTPAIVEGDEVIVRETWTDEYGQHFSTGRYPIDGERFYWSAPNDQS